MRPWVEAGSNQPGIRNAQPERCSEREPADSLRDKSNVIGGWLPSLTFALSCAMYWFEIAGKVDWKLLHRQLESCGIKQVRVSGGMGTFFHLFRKDGREFSIVDDGFNDCVSADDQSLLEYVRSEYFADYRPGAIKEHQ